ncbi:MAG: OmpH family outer membrane protein [Bacteroidales bacterium]|nr:OmpH family outer membrane protein [Bacteroidales bacterium]MCF8390326.1 OmpH family outer membrane protein [Bacteroidales bacterium]
MKRINLIINVVLVIAVGVLYFLHFQGDTDSKNPAEESLVKASVSNGTEIPIAFVRIDTLLNSMEMFSDINNDLITKQQKLESSIATQYKAFEKEVAGYQDKVSKGLLTRKEAQDIEAQLGLKGQDLEGQRNNYMAELQEEGMVGQNKVINYIMEYLEVYNSDNKFKYIFSYSFGGGLLFASDALDITPEVLAGINQKYAEEKSSKK